VPMPAAFLLPMPCRCQGISCRFQPRLRCTSQVEPATVPMRCVCGNNRGVGGRRPVTGCAPATANLRSAVAAGTRAPARVCEESGFRIDRREPGESVAPSRVRRDGAGEARQPIAAGAE
jgi:hypothetical protein